MILIFFYVASKSRQVKRGVKEVVKGIRKGEKGYETITPSISAFLLILRMSCKDFSFLRQI